MMSQPDWRPTASLDVLKRRSDLLQLVRQFFLERTFIEVETPVLSADVVVDRHLDPVGVTLPDDPRWPEMGRKMWLQTSPEFGMKRLLAAGATAIFQFSRVFRGSEQGRLHNPEFTMVEWYRTGDDMRAGMELLSELAEHVLGRGPAEILTYAEAFQRYAGVDPHRADENELRAAATQVAIAPPASFVNADRDAWLDLLLTERIQANLGVQRPTILCDYPTSQAALARIRPGEPPVAERFELYVDGIELANGYHELLDADVLRQRNATANARRAEDGKPALPEESRLLAAMDAGLPACCGVALGFDRLVMVALGAKSLADVMAFPIERV